MTLRSGDISGRGDNGLLSPHLAAGGGSEGTKALPCFDPINRNLFRAHQRFPAGEIRSFELRREIPAGIFFSPLFPALIPPGMRESPGQVLSGVLSGFI